MTVNGSMNGLEIDIAVLGVGADQLDGDAISPTFLPRNPSTSRPSVGGRRMRTHVPRSVAPVTRASKRTPILDSKSRAAAHLPTCRSTFFAASSCSVQ